MEFQEETAIDWITQKYIKLLATKNRIAVNIINQIDIEKQIYISPPNLKLVRCEMWIH